MTVTLRNVDYQFLNIIESILPLCKGVEVDTLLYKLIQKIPPP